MEQLLLRIIGVVIFIAVYFLPTIVAINKERKGGSIFINIVFGWTLIGWIGSLLWAMSLPLNAEAAKRRSDWDEKTVEANKGSDGRL